MPNCDHKIGGEGNKIENLKVVLGTKPTYEIKNYKELQGHDGPMFTCSLYKDGKRIAHVSNDGNGGETRYDFELENRKELEKEFRDYAATQPPYVAQDGSTWDCDADMLISRMLDKLEEKKWYRNKCKNQTMFRLEGEDPHVDGWRTVEAPYTQVIAAKIRKKYPGTAEIANETRI